MMFSLSSFIYWLSASHDIFLFYITAFLYIYSFSFFSFDVANETHLYFLYIALYCLCTKQNQFGVSRQLMISPLRQFGTLSPKTSGNECSPKTYTQTAQS